MEKIEILGLEIFKTHVQEMSTVERIQQFFNQGIGWHYYLDIAWIVREISQLPRGSLILDAGAGSGLAQFVLMELGYNVISADFANRCFGQQYLDRYSSLIFYANDQSAVFDNVYTQHLQKNYGLSIRDGLSNSLIRTLKRGLKKQTVSDPIALVEKERYKAAKGVEGCDFDAVLQNKPRAYCGRNFVYKCDLKDMSLLPDNYVDGVISVSALEHNNHTDFRVCVNEIERITKPGGFLAITVSASQAEDWFHEPSKGWCYSEASLKSLFDLPDNVESNFSQKNKLFAELKVENNDLHKRLAPFYYKSGDNGMPWGKWAPHYQPVGIIKVKK